MQLQLLRYIFLTTVSLLKSPKNTGFIEFLEFSQSTNLSIYIFTHYNLLNTLYITKRETILNTNIRSKHFIGIFHMIYIPNNPRKDLRSKVINFHYRPNLAVLLLRVLASTTLRQQNIHASRDSTSNVSPLNNQDLVRLSHPCKYSTKRSNE